MSDKQAKIQKLLEMQKKFIEYEHQNGVSAQEYFTPESGSTLESFREDYNALAMEICDLAHTEKGSKR